MIRMDGAREIPPGTKMSYEWFNSLQDEICTPIEATQTLNPKCDQLEKAIGILLFGKGIHLGEVQDYSGNPVPIPGLVVKGDEAFSFALNLEVLPKREPLLPENLPVLFQEWVNPSKVVTERGDFTGIQFHPFDLDTSSSNFNSVKDILSSEDLLDKFSSFGDPRSNDPTIKGYKKAKLPEIEGFTEQEAVSMVRGIYAKKCLERPPLIQRYTFARTQKGYSHFTRHVPLMDLNLVKEFYSTWIDKTLSDTPKEFLEQHAKTLFMYFLFDMRISPIVLAADTSGQIHYFFNRMIFGDTLKINLSLFHFETQSI